MISIPADLLTELMKDVLYVKHLVTFEFPSRTCRFTDCDQNLRVADWTISDVELVSNGGMENGDPPTGWNSYNGPDTFERSGVQKHSGSYSLHMAEAGGGNPGFQSDALSLGVGKRYKVSFWYYKVAGTANWFMNTGEAGAALTVDGAWTHVETEFVEVASTTIAFSFTGNAEIYIDDVSILGPEYQTHWYDSHPIQFEPISTGTSLEASNLEITLSNIDKTFSDLILSEDIRESPCAIKRVFLDKNLAAIGDPITIFTGYVDNARIDREDAKISVADELIRWKTIIPRRDHSEHCGWKDFKGTECQYAGAETWCDRTKARCIELANYDNFGGFAHVVELQDKEIWWGRISSSLLNLGEWRKSRGH